MGLLRSRFATQGRSYIDRESLQKHASKNAKGRRIHHDAAAFSLSESAPPWLAFALFFVAWDRHRLQRWREQAQGDGEVVEPVVQSVVHSAPLTGQPHG